MTCFLRLGDEGAKSLGVRTLIDSIQDEVLYHLGEGCLAISGALCIDSRIEVIRTQAVGQTDMGGLPQYRLPASSA